MLLSKKWLNDYIEIDMAPRDFSEAMTISGSKVEVYEDLNEKIKNVVVGKILKIEKHPDADKLVVCQVDVGKEEPVQIVTGAKNVNEGDLVPCCLDNSLLPNGTKIKKGKLRGVPSYGMMCSIAELGMTLHDFPNAIEDGIFILNDEGVKVGDDIKYLIGYDDVITEFEITPNRPDCLSIIGLAREAAATFEKDFEVKKPIVKAGTDDINNYLTVEVKNTELCKRYTARVVKDIKIEPSPRWMRERLRACGVRPINNIVDITNYVMLEYGQPMHAFDYACLNGKNIVVRNAVKGENIETLDDQKREIDENVLVIADKEKPVALAGVMGGANSEITDDTKIVVFESANFNGAAVRYASRKAGVRTESSARFEKGLDPRCAMDALERACELVELLNAGTVINGVIDIDNSDKEFRKIKFDVDWINSFLGSDISKEQMTKILVSLKFGIEDDYIIVPSFRADVEGEADIAEEIARIYGYDKIPSHMFKGETAQGKYSDIQKFRNKINDALLSMGVNEIMTYSFMSPKEYDLIMLDKDAKERNGVVISNPLGEDTSTMRTTIIPSMLKVASGNYNHRNLEAKLFELGKVYIPKDKNELPLEKEVICVCYYGANENYLNIKGCVDELLDVLNIKVDDIQPVNDNPTFHPYRTANIFVKGVSAGIVGEIHPLVLKNYGIDVPLFMAVLDVDTLFNNTESKRTYKKLPKFPAVTRDLSLLCDDDISVMSLEKVIRSKCGNLCENVVLFDVYKGEQIEKGKKSVSFSYTLRAADRTLSDEEINNINNKILAAFEKMGIFLR